MHYTDLTVLQFTVMYVVHQHRYRKDTYCKIAKLSLDINLYLLFFLNVMLSVCKPPKQLFVYKQRPFFVTFMGLSWFSS